MINFITAKELKKISDERVNINNLDTDHPGFLNQLQLSLISHAQSNESRRCSINNLVINYALSIKEQDCLAEYLRNQGFFVFFGHGSYIDMIVSWEDKDPFWDTVVIKEKKDE